MTKPDLSVDVSRSVRVIMLAPARRTGHCARVRDVMTEEELGAIQARAHAATNGPWKAFVEGRDHWGGGNFIRVHGLNADARDMFATL